MRLLWFLAGFLLGVVSAEPVALMASLEEAAEGAARVAASRGIGAEERQIGGSRP